MVQVDLVAVEFSSGWLLPCVVTTSESTESCEISVSLDESDVVQGHGYDFEEALKVLRAQLEARGLHLLCNRFRRDAYVTSLSRQMNRGLSCYLVVPRRPVDPAQIVACLGAASPSDVVSAEVAEAFIAKWRARPSIRVLLTLAWRGLRGT
jgi:hypothetical protein